MAAGGDLPPLARVIGRTLVLKVPPPLGAAHPRSQQAGSGGAVIGTWDGDPERLSQLRSAYEAIGAGFAVPRVRGAPADDDAWPATEPGLP